MILAVALCADTQRGTRAAGTRRDEARDTARSACTSRTHGSRTHSHHLDLAGSLPGALLRCCQDTGAPPLHESRVSRAHSCRKTRRAARHLAHHRASAHASARSATSRIMQAPAWRYQENSAEQTDASGKDTEAGSWSRPSGVRPLRSTVHGSTLGGTLAGTVGEGDLRARDRPTFVKEAKCGYFCP